ncbi:hypothetical protein FSP39_021172 [Pinctada imbricata]|uniref:Glycosyl transferase family 25 domain-containing protein n=1 Tax=Pinctada imbricata TaxID=66713 RepID=A0AA88Y6B4_PINIB|nr:hypothetical protein FSP39_021172 [Pinctada imbricata]
MVAVLVRNKEFILPWFLGHLENLDYPKHNIEVWIRSDHNIDYSSAILNQWVTAVRMEYQDVDLLINDTITEYDDEDGPCHWSRDRMNRVIALRQEALETARRKRIDYLFMLDADIVLENKDTLNILMAINRTVVSPMMSPPDGEAYCNFWGAMTDNGYYERSNTYFDIVRRSKTGVFECALVHSAVLIDMHSSLTGKFSYSPRSGPEDDMIIFAMSVKEAAFRKPLRPSPHVYLPEPVLDTMGFDQIYVINLKRRPKRKKQMIATLKELGLNAHFIEAVDGR